MMSEEERQNLIRRIAEELDALVAEYLETCDASHRHERYGTDRDFSEDELRDFVEWLKAKRKAEET